MKGVSEMATMQPDLEKQIRDIYTAINARDVERFLSFHTDDVIIENVATGLVTRGKGEEARVTLNCVFAAIPDYRMELTSYFASGNRLCEEYVVSGTHTGDHMGIPATGKSFSCRGVLVRELREGKTCRACTYYDSATLLRQLGVLPQTP
jgi:steroid delta-isomerase-like uncharacterized protein